MGVWWVLEKPAFFLHPSHCWLTINYCFLYSSFYSVLDVGLLTVFFFSFFQFLGSVISVTDDTKLVTKVGLWVSPGKMTIPLVFTFLRE